MAPSRSLRSSSPSSQSAVSSRTSQSSWPSPSPSLNFYKAVRHGGIQKNRTKPDNIKTDGKVVAVTSFPLSPGPASPVSESAEEKAFPFLSLPGELRNKIYAMTFGDPRQALIKHRPRHATLRPRKRAPNEKPSRRHCIGLTQVCRQIRYEYRPWYLKKQPVGLDLVDLNAYLKAFYPSTKTDVIASKTADRMGSVTVALNYRLSAAEKSEKGIDLWPMLDMWANAYRLEAGFGRYAHDGYRSEEDGEAKDLYRLFGRRVLQDRTCTSLVVPWRDLLRERRLAAVRVHRAPRNERAYIHILFKLEHKESWMDVEVAQPPNGWLDKYGFNDMEYFNIKVGVAFGSTEREN